MGKEQSAEFYDGVYSGKLKTNSTPLAYRVSYKLSTYYTAWKIAIGQTTKEQLIGDLGCGVGQFAAMCVANGRNYRLGIDFSEVAIQQAKELNPKIAKYFKVGNLLDDGISKLVKELDAVFILEVLEHITNDKELLNSLPKGIQVVFSVPNYDSAGHVRHFKTYKDVEQRYYSCFKSLTYIDSAIVGVKRDAKIFIFSATK
jgi:2-polyprenyl-3-methyl-5-hydroxy-6-metoxy-1,4-benzoquinol methylase